ncbi:hypothetical protein HK096_008645 [Nowakowskiella sp. JEL0078]|nr:hypothetical protein HK096_008645 [Nowakowskiella sp. JEL0078]
MGNKLSQICGDSLDERKEYPPVINTTVVQHPKPVNSDIYNSGMVKHGEPQIVYRQEQNASLTIHKSDTTLPNYPPSHHSMNSPELGGTQSRPQSIKKSIETRMASPTPIQQVEIISRNSSFNTKITTSVDERKTTTTSVDEKKTTTSSGSGEGSSQTKHNLVMNEAIAGAWQPKSIHNTRANARLDNKRRFHAVESSLYPLPADIEEQDRLEIQHMVLTHMFGNLFHFPLNDKLKRKGGMILDMGCGPGSWSRDVASKYPLAEIYAVDMAKTLFDGVETLPNITFIVGNVLEGLPFPDNYFDVVYQRYLVLAIPKSKWLDCLRELKRVTKPGGYIELVELDLELLRGGPLGSMFHNAVSKSMEIRGLDMDIGILHITF